MGVSLGEMYVLMGAPLRALLEVARDTMGTEVLLAGQMNLLFYPELEHGGARRVMDFLERREDVANLLRQKPGQVSFLIGREMGRPELDKSALGVARYQVTATTPAPWRCWARCGWITPGWPRSSSTWRGRWASTSPC